MGGQCHICEQFLPSQSALENHLTLHDPADRVVCRGCGAESTTLRRHRAHSRRCFPCRICFRRFASETRRDEHVCLVTNGQPLVCACGCVFVKYDDIVKHARGPRPFHCCVCDHTAASLTSHIRHIRKHSKQKPFECSHCARTFSSIEFLKNHVRKDHEETGGEIVSRAIVSESGELREECPDCGKSFRASRIEAHRAKHKRSSCLCPECGKMFHSHCHLSQHLVTTHFSEPVTCDHCQKVLKTKKILSEHLKTHLKTEAGTRVAQAVCPMCGLELAQKGSLARHIVLVHERHRLKRNDAPRTCRECGLTLPGAAQYYSHRRQHRAAMERFPCSVCSREFNKKQNLLRHMYLLHDQQRVLEKPGFACDLCCRMFRERRNMVRHYRLVHKVDMGFS